MIPPVAGQTGKHEAGKMEALKAMGFDLAPLNKVPRSVIINHPTEDWLTDGMGHWIPKEYQYIVFWHHDDDHEEGLEFDGPLVKRIECHAGVLKALHQLGFRLYDQGGGPEPLYNYVSFGED